MKTTKFLGLTILVGLLSIVNWNIQAQNRQKIAVVSMDTKNIPYDNEALTSLVHLELEKIGKFEVLDKFDASDILKENKIDLNACLGKNCQVRVGKLLSADKMLSGSIEKFGQKVIIVLRLIDVKTEAFEKSDVAEYINQLDDLQIMIQLSLSNLLGLSSDTKMKELLVYYAQPISSPKTTANLNGPRMGVSYISGNIGSRLSAPKDQGGYNMYPAMMMFGYQHEVQYLSAGYFQALVEFIFAVNGLESGMFSPSFMVMNGLRFNKMGLEFGVGPIIRVSKMAKGYFDNEGIWHKTTALNESNAQYKLVESLDSRGDVRLSSGMVIAVGKTFTSGYLNMPVNVFFSPRKEGNVFGLTFGFNVSKTTRPVVN
jgi:TolB-like protein